MPASWRPSRGPGYELDEIRALAGTDRMTIPPTLLQKLAESYDTIPRTLHIPEAKQSKEPLIGGGNIGEKEFRYLLNMDGCGTEKLAEGIRSFIRETEKLEVSIAAKVNAALTTKQPAM
jgi:transaldolase